MPWALVATLALFAACETAVWRSPGWLRFVDRYAPAGPADPALSTARVRLLPRGDERAVLLFGSSQIREGLSCTVLETRLPSVPCANLAFGGGAPLDVLQVAAEARARRPHHVAVLGLFPKVLHMGPKAAFFGTDAARVLLASGAWRGMGGDAWRDAGYGLVGSLSPTLRTRDGLWAMWGELRGDLRRAVLYERPALPPRMLALDSPQPDRYFDNRLGLVDFDIRPNAFTAAQEEAFDTFVREERAAGNTVVVIDFPTRVGYETTITSEAVRHYRAYIERVSRRPDIVFVSSADLPPLLAEDFLDFTHLAESGRAAVSYRVAEIVAAVLEGRSVLPGAAGQQVQRVPEQRP